MSVPFFVAIEGIDGSGQTTQSRILSATLREEGIDAVAVEEPTSEPTGRLLRRWLAGEFAFDQPESIATLFLLDRYEHFWSTIRPALDSNMAVVCNRYHLSWEVYQSAELTNEWLNGISMYLAVERPHLTIVLDMYGHEKEAMARVKNRKKPKEVYEKLDFQKRISLRYLERASRSGVSSVCTAVVNGAMPKEAVAKEVRLLALSVYEHLKEIKELQSPEVEPQTFTPSGVNAIYWKSVRARERYVQNHKHLTKVLN